MTADPLRITIVHNRYRSAQPSGEDHVVDREHRLLADAGHEVSIFERHSDDIAAMSLPRKAAVPMLVPWNPVVRAEFRRRLRAYAPDVVHIHNTFPLISPSVVQACADEGVPAVATLHNYTMICPPGTLHRDGGICTDCVGRLPLPAVRHGCYRGSSAATVPLAVSMSVNRRRWWSGVSRFFCVSHAQRNMLVQAGMPAERLTVKHNFVADPGRVRTGAGKHLLYLGRMTEEKGVRLLMSAWDLLAKQGGLGVPLVLAGTGPLQHEVEAWARCRDDVWYLGLRTSAECRELTADSVAVVAPSTWLEGFGLVAVEGMASGVPPVAAGHGAFVELIEHGHTGLLHRPGDVQSLAACLEQVVDTKVNETLGQAARRRYEQNFSPEAGLRGLVAGYRSALAAPGTCEPI